MSVRVFLAAGLLTGLWLCAAHAAEPGGPPPPTPGGPPPFGPGPGLPPPLKEADANKDGKITRAETDAAIAARFKAADANTDGTLDAKEFASAMPKPPEPPKDVPKAPDGRPHRPPFDPAARFGATDWNGDGKLSLDEFAVPLKAMAIQADRNGDGVIAEEELKRPPHGPHGRPRPPH